jgi:hypothetical protein
MAMPARMRNAVIVAFASVRTSRGAGGAFQFQYELLSYTLERIMISCSPVLGGKLLSFDREESADAGINSRPNGWRSHIKSASVARTLQVQGRGMRHNCSGARR